MDKKEALENALKQIEKDFGKGSIMRLGEATANMNVEVIPTGILPLDVALGIGGLPRGRGDLYALRFAVKLCGQYHLRSAPNGPG